MMKLLDRIKFLGKKASDNVVKITSMEELQFYADKKRKQLNEMKEELKNMKAERKYHQDQLERLQDSKNDVLKAARRHKSTIEDESSSETAKERARDQIMDAKRLVENSDRSITMLEKTIATFDKMIVRGESAVKTVETEFNKLTSSLDELRLKESLTKTFKKYKSVDLGDLTEHRIDELVKDIEVNFNSMELNLEEMESKENISVDSFLSRNSETSFDDFYDSL